MDWGLTDWKFWALSIPLTAMFFFIIKYVMKERNWHWNELSSAVMMGIVGLGNVTRENHWVPVFFFAMAIFFLVQWRRKNRTA